MRLSSVVTKTLFTITLPLCLLALLLQVSTGESAQKAPVYSEMLSTVHAFRSQSSKLNDTLLEQKLIFKMNTLFDYWYKTRWGLGAPQTQIPQQGKINCGTFIGRTLSDLGFNLNVKKFQRQPAELAIKSLVPRYLIKRFRYASMKKFLKGVRNMGQGLYIVGLDFHIGYLLVKENKEVRFIHASYLTHTVINELADTAIPLKTSSYRVIGKLFSSKLLKKWRTHRKIKVLGNW